MSERGAWSLELWLCFRDVCLAFVLPSSTSSLLLLLLLRHGSTCALAVACCVGRCQVRATLAWATCRSRRCDRSPALYCLRDRWRAGERAGVGVVCVRARARVYICVCGVASCLGSIFVFSVFANAKVFVWGLVGCLLTLMNSCRCRHGQAPSRRNLDGRGVGWLTPPTTFLSVPGNRCRSGSDECVSSCRRDRAR